MIEKTEAVTSNLLKLALDAASLNHQAIANNIANINTAGYAPARVSFEEQLDAVRQTIASGGQIDAGMLHGIHPTLVRGEPLPEGDRTASLDLETAKLAENTVHYEALLKVAGIRMSMLGAAINEGKR
ncbi:MAG: flagellar basal body protein [Burkholderiales bacterium]|nr:flagellar basal body protein [Burkholderiales bacterium]